MMRNPVGRITQGQFSFLPDLTDQEIITKLKGAGIKKYEDQTYAGPSQRGPRRPSHGVEPGQVNYS